MPNEKPTNPEPKAGATKEGWHEIAPLFRCEFEYLLARIRKVVLSGVTETPAALAQGLVHHAMRAAWFENRFKWDAATEAKVLGAARLEGQKQKLPILPEDERTAINLFAAYMDHYRYLPRPTVVGVEYAIDPVEVVPGFTRTARLDDVSHYVEGGGALWIGEAKTTSASIEKTIAYYEMSGQLMLQYLLWEVAPNGKAMHGPISGIMLDIAKKPYGEQKPEFARYAVPITENMRRWFAATLQQRLGVRAEMQSIGWDAPAEHNPTACKRLTAGGYVMWCEYVELCKHGRSASGMYQFEDGRSLLDHAPVPGMEKMPWE